MKSYNQLEEEVLNEVPYNWKKHMLLQMPDAIAEAGTFVVKFILVIILAETIAVAIMSTAISVTLSEVDSEVLEQYLQQQVDLYQEEVH